MPWPLLRGSEPTCSPGCREDLRFAATPPYPTPRFSEFVKPGPGQRRVRAGYSRLHRFTYSPNVQVAGKASGRRTFVPSTCLTWRVQNSSPWQLTWSRRCSVHVPSLLVPTPARSKAWIDLPEGAQRWSYPQRRHQRRRALCAAETGVINIGKDEATSSPPRVISPKTRRTSASGTGSCHPAARLNQVDLGR